MKGRDIIYEVSVDLNDQERGHEYTRWTYRQLESYLREALDQIYRRMKSWFHTTKVVKVEPGKGWQVACDCDEILRIHGESDASGRILRYLDRLPDDERLVWAKDSPRCRSSASEYIMTGYSLSWSDSSVFKIHPPIPHGVEKHVVVECFEEPSDAVDTQDVKADAVPIVKQWMLYRALMMDSENNATVITLAKEHKETFFTLLKMAIELEALEEIRVPDNLRAVQERADK